MKTRFAKVGPLLCQHEKADKRKERGHEPVPELTECGFLWLWSLEILRHYAAQSVRRVGL